MNFLRTLRYQKIFEYKIKLTKMFSINSYHNYLNHTIPYRLGEFGLIYFMKNEEIEVTKSFSALIFTKILNFSIAGLIFFGISIATVFVFDHPELYLIASSIIGIISITGFFFILYTKKFITLYEKIFLYFFRNQDEESKKNNLIFKLGNKIKEIGLDLEYIKKKHGINYFITISTLIKIVQLITTILIFYSLNVDLPLYVILINDLFLSYATYIPLALFAGLGLYEYSFSFLILLQGISLTEPYNTGFAWHLIIILFQFLNLIAGYVIEIVGKIQKSNKK